MGVEGAEHVLDATVRRVGLEALAINGDCDANVSTRVGCVEVQRVALRIALEHLRVFDETEPAAHLSKQASQSVGPSVRRCAGGWAGKSPTYVLEY